MIGPSQRPLPDNKQHSQQTNIHASGGIRTHDRSRRAAVDLRLRPRGYWDRHILYNCGKIVEKLWENLKWVELIYVARLRTSGGLLRKGK